VNGTPEREGFTSINVTPLVDVMLVLLIVFMVTSPMLVTGVNIDVAQADTGATAEAPKVESVPLTVQADGSVLVADAAAPDVEAAIRQALASSGARSVAVAADANCRYEDVAAAIAAARRAGASGIELVLAPGGAS
jgi:biopolymer transport protein TolR